MPDSLLFLLGYEIKIMFGTDTKALSNSFDKLFSFWFLLQIIQFLVNYSWILYLVILWLDNLIESDKP